MDFGSSIFSQPAMSGIPKDAKIVLLIVRDDAYLDKAYPDSDWSYQNYRDCSIDRFRMVSEELAYNGFYVIRFGAHVNRPLEVDHPHVIDYAFNKMRNDFMDIYLSSICNFVISTSSGAEIAASYCFRKPIVFANCPHTEYLHTYLDKSLYLTKHHYSEEEKRNLKLSEIFSREVGICLSTPCYEDKGIKLVENTPSEIRDVVMEMAYRLNGSWKEEGDDEELQNRFWSIFPVDAISPDYNKRLHGKIRGHYSAKFLRDNREWLE